MLKPLPLLLLALGALLGQEPARPGARAQARAPLAAHRTTLELRLSQEAAQVELALQVGAADLARALSAGQPRPVDLTQPQALPLADLYLARHLTLSLPAAPRRPRRPLPMQFQGLRAEKNTYWLYAKAPLPQPTTELRLRHTVLLELYPDQQNVVRAEGNGKRLALVFRRGQEEQVLNF